MKKYIQYNVATGEITQIFDCSENDSIEHLSGYGYGIIESDGDYPDGYVQNDELVPFPERPSPYHEWDCPTKSWLPNLAAAREVKLQQVTAELGIRLYLPCNGFDADKVSRERISGMIARLQRGDGLPVGWVGWRDASNDMHWAADDAATVLTSITALSLAIENREQVLLIAAWQHKATLESVAQNSELDDEQKLQQILSYNVSACWPT